MSWEALNKIQPEAAKILMNSIRRGRLAHAYLFSGGRGTGKKKAAFLLAQSFLCRRRTGENPCFSCSDCRRIESGNHPDVHVLSPEGQSIKKEQITGLMKEFSYRGLESRRKFYLIEHIDKMTTNAANSLLKFLEEPGVGTVAILLTDHVHRVLETIESRCQVISFRPLSWRLLRNEKLYHSETSSPLLFAAAEMTNDVEEARNLAEDPAFAEIRNLVIQLMEELQKRPLAALLFLQEKWLPYMKDREMTASGLDFLLLWHRDLFYARLGERRRIVFSDHLSMIEQQAKTVTESGAVRKMEVILDARRRLEANVNPQFVMEQAVIRLQEV